MNDSIPRPGSDALSLKARIKAALDSQEMAHASGHRDVLLFFGNRQTLLPVRVVEDKILEPVDKLVWMVIVLQAGDTGKHSVFPTHDEIRKTANISSKSTVARAIAVLRATRWLTLFAGKQGEQSRNLFLLHDQPLPLADIAHLDTGYVKFLREAQTHYHARVRAVAKEVLQTLDAEIQAGLDVGAHDHPIAYRTETTNTEGQDASSRFLVDPDSDSAGQKEGVDPNQNFKSVHNLAHQYLVHQKLVHQKSNSDRSGSGETADARLVYPARLSANQRELATRYLKTLSLAQRQLVLDELEGRIRSEQRGMSPLYDDLSFLNSLCNAMKRGKFKENLGVKVVEERAARAAACKQRQQTAEPPPTVANIQVLRQQISVGKGPLEEMRKALGIRRRVDRSPR